MAVHDHVDFNGFMEGLKRRNPHQPEFVQAVQEVAEDIFDFMADKEEYHAQQILRRIAEPDRVVSFRVCWEDDQGNVRVQRGWRVQNNNAIGPYKGGLRFHPSVSESVLKFLAFEQTFKNALTGLPMGGGKGGSNFNPKGKSVREIMRFCQSFMTELYRHIGADVDVPAGDIGVGAREIGFMFGQYKRITGQFTGVLTGKGLEYGGSLIRPEATGYGAVYFLANMLATRGQDLKGKTAVISGAGNVATHAAEKLVQIGAKVLTLSDSGGFVFDPDGFDLEKIDWVKTHKTHRRGRIEDYVAAYPKAEFHAGKTPEPAFPPHGWRHCPALRHPERTAGRRRPHPGRQRLRGRVRRRKYADRSGRGPRIPRGQIALCPGQGIERGRRGRFGPGNEPEFRTPGVEGRRPSADADRHHGRHSQGVPSLRR
jgi:glutamate dehydrogenase (NADP+)